MTVSAHLVPPPGQHGRVGLVQLGPDVVDAPREAQDFGLVQVQGGK